MGYARKKTGTAGGGATSRPVPPSAASGPSRTSIWNMQFGGAKQKTDMKRVEVLLFVSELADLLEAGMTLGQSLKALANQGDETGAQRYVCQDLCDRIVRGENFSDACAKHPKTFPPLFSNMLRAGEASGAMVEVLRRLGEHYERDDGMRSKIKGALIYPAIILAFGVIAVVVTLVWIIPQFQKVFDMMGTTLPLPMRMLIATSNAVVHYGWFMAAGIAIAVVWFAKWKKTPVGLRRVDGWKLKIPLVKGIVACGAYSSLAYTMKTLLSNGVNVLHALKICEETCGNSIIGDALHTARERVTDGATISGPLASAGVFPRLMTDMLAVGEQSGDLPGALEHIGRRYQKDMDRNIASFTSALEPILIVLIAGVVGFVAVSIIMSVFKVSSSLG